eukprot:CAMPEP_0180133052 /NCGR_PEP_ID=MMETSP0986-20121125/9326_1 /TAXON_ID=697907 /ORGANISM="non described non described, Strain CCMP2293" /LENGTH=631 /DNA_ID=CAMNT_0022073127 /DNA_START=15 /DNA_END=1910 /DNA_ORIENTATION=-
MAGRRPALSSLVLLALLGSPVSAWFMGAPLRISTAQHRACSRRPGLLACAMETEKVEAKKVVLGSGLFAPDIGVGDDASPPPDPAVFVPLPKSDIEAVFGTVDADKNGQINMQELVRLAEVMGVKMSQPIALQGLWEMDLDKNGLVTFDELYEWYMAGNLEEKKMRLRRTTTDKVNAMAKLTRVEAETTFQLIDVDGNGSVEANELHELLFSLGNKWSEEKVKNIVDRIGVDGGVPFEAFYAWISSGHDFSEASDKAPIVQPTDADALKIFVRGFPWKAQHGTALKYFSRCGPVREVEMINWSRDGTPSGRCVITFEEADSVERAMALHRNRMGKRWLEIYRVNSGDKEVRQNVEKRLHGALIGIKGVNVRKMAEESGAMIYFESEPEAVMVIKGRENEREKAWALAKEIIEGNAMDAYPVPAALHGPLIGAKGKLKIMMEQQSGAHIVYSRVPSDQCQVFGTAEARARAWQMVQAKLWDMQNLSEERYPLPAKYHGTLIGKGSAVVKALEAETGVRIRFQTYKDLPGMESLTPVERAKKASMVARGPPKACEKAWAYSQVLLRELPLQLSELRMDEDFALGSLRSLPLSPAQVWSEAIEGAMAVARKEAGGVEQKAEVSQGVQEEGLLML